MWSREKPRQSDLARLCNNFLQVIVLTRYNICSVAIQISVDSQCEWAAVARQMKVDLETFSRNHGKQTGALTQNLMAVTRERYNYTEFLKKFAVLGERMKLNDDEFDYAYLLRIEDCRTYQCIPTNLASKFPSSNAAYGGIDASIAF